MTERGRILTTLEKEFFEGFFRRLTNARTASILLRNYAEFPAKMGNDVDIFFRRSDLKRAVGIFQKALSESGGEVIHVHERDYVLAVWFRVGRDEPLTIHLDFYHGAFSWHGLTYLNDDTLLASSRPFQQFRIPRPAHEAANLFLTSLLWGGFFKARYQEQIVKLLTAPDEAAEFDRIIESQFGLAKQFAFVSGLGEKSCDGQMRSYGARLRRTFRSRSFLRNPFAAFFRQSRYWLKEFADVISPPGIHIAILGPDGSGKSTVIAELEKRIGYYFGETVNGHLRPALLPDIGMLLGKRAKNSGPATDPHGQQPHSAVASFIRLIYFWLDYWLGYPLRVWKPRAKNHLVIFDRYSPDLWCDPRRYRLKLPKSLMKMICRLTPQPDLTFVLIGDASVIHRRKAEVLLKTLETLLQNYSEAATANRRTFAIDCNRPVSEVADEIAGLVLKHLKTKAERKLVARASRP